MIDEVSIILDPEMSTISCVWVLEHSVWLVMGSSSLLGKSICVVHVRILSRITSVGQILAVTIVTTNFVILK